ncbi:MAG: helicase HerA domain-containing protein [Candidatus Bathyarchaeia archaeon]|jgi:nucleotide-binding universal stress UspA family protein
MDLASVRIKEHFGLITNDTNADHLSFLVSPPKNRGTIEKQDVVCFDHPIQKENCQVLAQVKEIASYEEVAGSTIGERVGRMLATAKIIGYVDLRGEDKPLQVLLVPPNPGSRIYVPYASFLEDIFSRGVNGKSFQQRLCLGKTDLATVFSETNGDMQVNCFLNIADLTGKHTLVSGVDGVGKTHVAALIAGELAHQTNHPIVILDPHNEYTALLTMGSGMSKNRSLNIQSTSNDDTESTAKVKQGQITILTAESLSTKQKSEYYSTLLLDLAKSRREKKIDPFLIVIEDAENLSTAAVQEALDQRGIAAVLVTSHPSALGGGVLSKIATQLIGKTNDAQDTAFLKDMASGSDVVFCKLHVGEWVVSGLNIVEPFKVHVN